MSSCAAHGVTHTSHERPATYSLHVARLFDDVYRSSSSSSSSSSAALTQALPRIDTHARYTRAVYTVCARTCVSVRVFPQLATKEMKDGLKANLATEAMIVEKPMTQMGGIFYMMYQVILLLLLLLLLLLIQWLILIPPTNNPLPLLLPLLLLLLPLLEIVARIF